jgi:D-glycero-alpha-D-manno-heptose-7-phosphate kinase
LAAKAFEALCEGNLDPLGPMLDTAWRLKKGLSAGVSNDLVDQAYAAAIGAGAEGGKLLGAGGGGFLMFLAPPTRHDAIRAALGTLRETPLRFAAHGSSIIFVHE